MWKGNLPTFSGKGGLHLVTLQSFELVNNSKRKKQENDEIKNSMIR